MPHEPLTFIVRPAMPDDAERLISHVLAMTIEGARWLPMQPDEFPLTLEQERQFLAEVGKSDNSLFLLAETAGESPAEIVGLLNYAGGKRRAMRHVATLGISVRLAWQGRGVGTALMSEAIRRAKTSGTLRRLDLTVYADNHQAIRLYERMGFVVEGVRRRAILRDGEFIDEQTMAMVW
ncbi:GNAT family N-acetyltransferase [Humisphaera borealis]|uniref:GNAT family N-acetyltransferase n=1 Tax=Humisphaera borealis TaxID=2807512 RepID=A0A7M2WT74_9BACT|nr:GNAT family N-acetyltransferase [Humisphaera borealis]QOV88725.1 GNAT family N-acetyltransferase [Humisphaera borealis]